MKAVFAASLLACTCALFAQTAGLEASQRERDMQRERISRERIQLERAFELEESVCYQKFFTNSCLDEIKPRRREAIANLKRQEILLNETERRLKAAEQIARTEQKLTEERLQQESAARQQAIGELSGRAERSQKKASDAAGEDADAAKRAREAADKQRQATAKQQEAAERDKEAAARAEKTRLRQQEAARKRAAQERKLGAENKSSARSLLVPP